MSFHNDALFDLKHGGATAYSSPGLVVFLPISPARAVLLFDRNMYSARLRANQLVIHPSLSDVSSLNALTAANATRVLYYSPGQPHEEILAAYTLAKRVRALQRNVTFETIVKERGGQRRVLALSPSCAQLSMKLSFLRALPKRVKKMWGILARRPFPRHPELTCSLEAYEEANGDKSDSKLILALRENYPDLHSRLSEGGRAFLGPVALSRIPGIRKDILKAFAG
ncbi:hypothetical protein GCM10009105_10700 [Dokdonella soli]|uniref:DUF4123 domain-containing protein n=1 Tax=Dokdonella soli TaxID=529810 RepID=A0ABN1IE25_9GAMM